jgi:hypothetical protein
VAEAAAARLGRRGAGLREPPRPPERVMYKNLIIYGVVVLISICSVAVLAATNNPRPPAAEEMGDA